MKFFRKISNLTRFLIPDKKLKLKYKDYCCYLDLKSDINFAQNNYLNVIERIKKYPPEKKIKVIFLVRENQKWTYQSVYEEFLKSDKFEPLVLVSLLELARIGKDKTRNNLDENYNFFKDRNINVDYAIKDNEYINLKQFSPDIVFYDQPWDLPKIHEPLYVSEFALTCYSSYSFELIDTIEDYTSRFHRFLYKFFVEDELNKVRYEAYNKGNGYNCAVVGYPKLDEYFKPQNPCSLWKNSDKFKIIYAPHHSIEKNGLRLSTFLQNGKFILDFAKAHSETTWVFKPHPRLKYALLRLNVMSEEEINNYYKEWKNIGSIYTKGNYLDLFRSSDLMITDGCSFLAEYLPSKMPLVRLVNKAGADLNEVGNKLSRAFYSVNNNDDLRKILSDLINNIDPNKRNREKFIEEYFNHKETSAKKISDLLLNIIAKTEDRK